MPFFSIIIPSYNRAHTIEAVIDALSHQQCADFEAIVVDDGSTDNTPNLLHACMAKYQFLRYHRQENKGVCTARNAGALLATGTYLIFLDSDDSVTVAWLADFFELLNAHSYDVAFCNMKEVSANQSIRLVDATNPYNNPQKKGKYIAGMFAIKNAVFKEVGMYDENIKFGENTELGIRLRNQEVSMGFVPNYNFIYHISEGEGSKNQLNRLESNLYIVEKHPAYFEKNPVTKKLFLQVAAVAAARIGRCEKAHEIFGMLRKEHPTNLKIWLQFLITFSPGLTALKWKQQKS